MAAQRKVAVAMLVRDPHTDEVVFLAPGKSLPARFAGLVSEENLVPARGGSKSKAESAPAPEEDGPVEAAPEPAEKQVAAVADEELPDANVFDTE